MSYSEGVINLTFEAGEDLTNAQFSAVKLDSAGRVVETTDVTDNCIGILTSKAINAAVGTPVSVAAIAEGSKVIGKCDGAIVIGNLVVLGADDGTFAGVANWGAIPDDQQSLGIALTATAADGEQFTFLCSRVGPIEVS